MKELMEKCSGMNEKRVNTQDRARVMNIFKIDLMTVLFVVVLIGVIATMSSQANENVVNSSALTSVNVIKASL